MTGVDLLDQYVCGFRDRVLAMCRPGQEILEGPGLIGVLGGPDAVGGRVLITDDRALGMLSEHLPALDALVVNVLVAAEECHRLLLEAPGYRRDQATAMVCEDLAVVPEPVLPPTLTVCPVGVSAASSVALEDAAAAALRFDPTTGPSDELEGFVRYLRSVPNARFLAATDRCGLIRATAASANFGRWAGVFFVSTDPGWRGQGIGTAMTAAALRAAADSGAKAGVLDASGLGRSIYERLGFTAVSSNSLFVRTY